VTSSQLLARHYLVTPKAVFSRLKVQVCQPFLIGVLQPPIIMVALHWMCTGLTDLSPVLGPPDQTQYSRCHLPSAKQKGIITALNLLATLLLTQPRILLPCVFARLWVDSSFKFAVTFSLLFELRGSKVKT